MNRHTAVALMVSAVLLLAGGRRLVPLTAGPVVRCPLPHVAIKKGRPMLRCDVEGGRRTLTASQRLIVGLRININRAEAEDLEVLPRIGKVLSRRIVEERRLSGAFRSVEDLERVKGVGPATVDRLRSLVCADCP